MKMRPINTDRELLNFLIDPKIGDPKEALLIKDPARRLSGVLGIIFKRSKLLTLGIVSSDKRCTKLDVCFCYPSGGYFDPGSWAYEVHSTTGVDLGKEDFPGHRSNALQLLESLLTKIAFPGAGNIKVRVTEFMGHV